jgi:hypothetical protein
MIQAVLPPYHDNSLLYTLLIEESENPKTEDWKLKTEIR